VSSIRAEYQRFLTALAARPVAEDVRRMANLVFNNLQQLADVGSARRARSVRLAPIAVQHLAVTSCEVPAFTHVEAPARALGRLHELRVGPFRGFTTPETFDLSRPITLIYGPNGTGKSSFCEALETALLGSITEAQVKRLDHRTYCNNARLRRHVPPVLTSVGDEGAPTPVQPNEEAYRFCFIEKNRLDAFARIAARTPGDQRQLIATLFGVDQFADFVRGFNPSLDENLNLNGQLAQELATRRAQLAAAEQVIQTNPARLAQLDIQEAALATRINPNFRYSEVCDWLLGTETQQGRLPYVQACLDAPPPVVYGVTVPGLAALLDEAYRINATWLTSTAELARRSGEVSYQQLYDAVLKLADSVPGACPACGTSLVTVAQNPYERAATGLKQLAELSELQVRANEQREALQEAMRGLHVAMTNAVRAIGALLPDRLPGAALPILPAVSQGDWLNAWMDDERRAWQALLALCSEVERADNEARLLQEQRTALTVERQRLDAFRIEIERAKTLRAASEEQLGLARDTVARFDEANRELIAAVATEAPVVHLHQRVKVAYDGFLTELRSYLDGLPAQLLQGLAQNARDLYNSFNRDDPPADFAHALWLPLAENGKIELEFPGQPGVRYDALVVLSEGHIKCLGLAILLAKNLAENCPIVVFDDVVNAIDDEHRNGIWRTFFEDGGLDAKQVILTSHAEEFLLRIQQELGAARAQEMKCYKFLPHQGEHHLRIDSNPPSKNYVLLARQAFEADDKRDALRYSRPAIESLTDRLWTWMGRQGDGAIELKLSGPRSTWELNNKCSKLRSALNRRQNRPAGLESALTALVSLLGVNGGSIEWGYLNSGTHDAQRDGEFDRATVRTIVEAVVSLDQGLAELQRPR
jgi:energy-coupling factor transporter ATP-binding protein EcfA2